MNYAHLSIRVILVTLVISLLPLVALAHDKRCVQETAATIETTDIRGAANVPLRASELASFVLSAAALVTAGIALSRTKKRHHSTHHVA